MRRPKNSSTFTGRQYHRSPESNSRLSREQRREIEGERRRYVRTILRILSLVLLAWIIWYGATLSGGATISSNQGTEQEDILRADIKEYLSGLRRIKLLASLNELATELKTNNPSLADVRLYTTLSSRKIYVSASFRQPVAVLTDVNNSYLGAVDQVGIVYSLDNADLSGLPRIEEATDLSPQAGQPFIAVRTLEFIRQAESALAKAPEELTKGHRFRLVASNREVQLLISRPFFVKLSIDRAAADQINELAELDQHFKKRGTNPGIYVDLRVDDTAYYR